jgi:hypothetical protein
MIDIFEEELRKGKGLPIILLKNDMLILNDQTDQIIIDKIKTNTAYDPQCECSRYNYLYEVVLNYNRKEKIYPEIIKKFEAMTENDYSESQLAGFVANMVRDNLYSKKKYYNKISWYLNKYKTNYIPGISELIAMDGINAIKYLAKKIGCIIKDDEGHEISEFPFFEYLDDDIKEIIKMSSDEIVQILKIENDEDINIYLNFLETHNIEPSKHRRPSLVEIENNYRNGKYYPFRAWLMKASADEIKDISQLFFEIDDLKLKTKFLSNFNKIRIQIDENILWNELDKTNDTFYQSSIIEALILFKNPKIKELIDKYRENYVKTSALEAFISFIDEEDGEKLEYELINLDSFELHLVGIDIMKYERLKEMSYYSKILHLLYEKSECPFCREHIIREMILQNCLDDNILEELFYD